VTAQEAFRKMLKEEVAPALRRLGFKGSGQRYELPSETHWAIVGFQKFTWSDQDRVDFTVNVTVTDRDEWEHARKERPYLTARPSANVGAGVGWEKRIADIVPADRDLIWTVIAGQPTEPVAGDVVSVLADHVIPAVRRRIERGQRR
jgi:Domain of unknown function (DUF4304)